MKVKELKEIIMNLNDEYDVVMEFDSYENITHENGEKALVEKGTGKIIFNGDYYHDKIEYKIKGFFVGLTHVGTDHVLRYYQIDASHKMFEKLGFYDGSED